MDALRENDKRFDETWTRKRVLASPSEYDMALANAAVACDWTDQEVINMLIAHRRKHGDDLKLRLDYYIRTVGKARESQQAAATESKAFDALDDIIRDPTPLTPPQASELPEAATGAETQEQAATDVATPAAGHPTLMAAVSKLLGFEVSRWIQRGREPRRAEYSLVLPGGREVLIGNSAAFLKPSTFRHSILDALSIVMPMYKAGKWTTICKALTLGVEIVENDELYRDIQVTDWLRQYTAGGLQYVDKNWSLALPQCDPFIVDGLLHVHVGTFHKFIRLSLYEQISKTDLYGYLGTVGFDRVQKTARIEDIENPVSRSYFAGPAGVLDDLSKPL